MLLKTSKGNVPEDPPRALDFPDEDQPSTLARGLDPSAREHSKALPRGLDADSKELPTLSKGFGPGVSSGHNFGLGSFRVETVLPQPKPRPPKDPKLTSRAPESVKTQTTKQKEYYFEAYYILPRSVPRSQPRGQIQLTKPVPDDYMVICLDTRQDYRKDPNLRNALRRAKRAHDSVPASIVDEFPRTVREAAMALVSHRKRHGNGLIWSLVDGVELRCLEDSMFRKSSSKSGFLIVFRGSGSQAIREIPYPRSILKGSVNNMNSGSISQYPNAAPTQAVAERISNNTIVIKQGVPNSRRPDSPERAALRVESLPASSEPEQATAADMRPSLGKSSPDDTKKKAKVEFDNPEHLKSERPPSRRLSGPVLYDPARTKLLPKTPGNKYTSGDEYYNRNYAQAPSAHRYSMPPPASQVPLTYSPLPYYPASGPPPAHQSPPLSQAYGGRFRSPPAAHGTVPSYSMVHPPPPSLPGWTSSSQPSRPPEAPVGVPASQHSAAPNLSPVIVDNTALRPQLNQRHQSDSYLTMQASKAGRPPNSQYHERDRRGHERIILSGPRRQSAPEPPPEIYNGAESESQSESEGRSRRVIAIEQKRRRNRDEPRRRAYMDMAGAAAETVPSNIKQVSDSRDARQKDPGLSSLSTAAAALSVGAVRKSREDVEKEKTEAEQRAGLSKESAAIGSTAYIKGQSDEDPGRRRAERLAQVDGEIRRRPAVPMDAPKYPRRRSEQSRPVVTYYNEDTRDYRARPERMSRYVTEEKPVKGILRAEGRGRNSTAYVASYRIAPDPSSSRIVSVDEGNRARRSTLDSSTRPVIVTAALETRGQRYEIYGGRETISQSRNVESDSESTISDFSSESGDEESPLVGDKPKGEELHISPQEAEAMMMSFLATFTTV